MKGKVIIGLLSVIAILLLISGRFITVGYIENNDRNVESFSIISIWLGLISGIIMVVVSFLTFKTHFAIGILPFGVGFTLVGYCAYLLWCKSL